MWLGWLCIEQRWADKNDQLIGATEHLDAMSISLRFGFWMEEVWSVLIYLWVYYWECLDHHQEGPEWIHFQTPEDLRAEIKTDCCGSSKEVSFKRFAKRRYFLNLPLNDLNNYLYYVVSKGKSKERSKMFISSYILIVLWKRLNCGFSIFVSWYIDEWV